MVASGKCGKSASFFRSFFGKVKVTIRSFVNTWVTPYIPLQDNQLFLKLQTFQRTILPIFEVKSSLSEDPLNLTTLKYYYTLIRILIPLNRY